MTVFLAALVAALGAGAAALGAALMWQEAMRHGHPGAAAGAVGAWLGSRLAVLRWAGPVRLPDAERLRLGALAAGCGLLGGAVLVDPLAGLLAGLAAPWLLGVGLRARRARWRLAIERQVPEIALGLAAALEGGRSLRGGLAGLSGQIEAPARRELERVAAELAAGERTAAVLERLRLRVRSQRLDVVAAAIAIQSRAGGDLARLLRDIAASSKEQEELERDARAATAQARFTGLVVAIMPLAAALLVELVSPGAATGLFRSFVGMSIATVALALQAAGALAIRRIARVKV